MKEIREKDNRPFAERHPRINFIFGVLLLVGLIYISYIVISFIVNRLQILVGQTIKQLSEMTSNLDAVIIVSLITGAVSIVSVVISTVGSRIFEYMQRRREYLYQKREGPYSDFVTVIYKLVDKTKRDESYSETEMISDINKFSKDLTLWGSNRVIKKWLKFREISNGKQPDNATTLYYMEDILYAMRKDLGLRRMKQGNLLAFFINDIHSVKKRKE